MDQRIGTRILRIPVFRSTRDDILQCHFQNNKEIKHDDAPYPRISNQLCFLYARPVNRLKLHQGDSKLGAEPGDGEIFVVLAAFDSDLR
jgi:hypothetical protein